MERLKQLLDWLSKFSGTYTAFNEIPQHFGDIKNACIEYECAIEHQKLVTLINEKNSTDTDLNLLKQDIKRLCHDRHHFIKDTALSFTAAHDSSCNVMYWGVVQILFEPKNLREMLDILMPGIKKLEIQYSAITRKISKSHLLKDRIKIELVEANDLKGLEEYRCLISFLSEMVVAENTLILLKEIMELPFFLHAEFKQLMRSHYSKLNEKLYEHNEDLRQLKREIESNLTPYQAIKSIIRDLKRSGSRYTGNEHALEFGVSAVGYFIGYLERLPEDTRKSILALQSLEGESVEIILQELIEGGCVEEGSEDFSSILLANEDNSLLKTTPKEIAHLNQRVLRQYNENLNMEISGKEINDNLPEAIASHVFSQIKISTKDDCVDLLTNFPDDQYGMIFKYAQFYQGLVGKDLSAISDMLDQMQYRQLRKALLTNFQRLGGVLPMMRFFEYRQDILYRLKLASFLPKDEGRNLLSKNNEDGSTLFHEAIYDPECHLGLFELVSSYSEQDRYSVISLQNKFGLTLIHVAITENQDDLVIKLLSLLSAKNQIKLALIRSYYSFRCSIIHAVIQADNVSLFNKMMSLFSSEDPGLAILENIGRRGETALHAAVLHATPEMIGAVLSKYPTEKKLAAVLHQNQCGETALQLAKKKNDGFFEVILGQLSAEEQECAKKSINKGKEAHAIGELPVIQLAPLFGSSQFFDVSGEMIETPAKRRRYNK